MKIRVANIMEDGRVGGPQLRTVLVSAALKKLGVETAIVLPKQDSEVFWRSIRERKLKAIPMRLHRISRKRKDIILYFLYFLPEVIGLIKMIRRSKTDLVHCNGSWQIKGIIAGKIAGTRVIWHLNDTREIGIIMLVTRLVGEFLCDGFIFASGKTKEMCFSRMSITGIPFFEIQAPVDIDKFNPDKVKNDKKWRQNKGFTILTIGNVNRAKGLEYFVHMSCLLNKIYKDLVFLVVGHLFPEQAEYIYKLKEIIRKNNCDNIFFLGWLTDVRSVLKAADIYVCSSIHEASPMSVWEAMSMGRPIVSTDVGDVARFIKDGENGFIVPPCNAEALANKVGMLLRDEDLRNKFSAGVRQVAIENFDINVCARKHALVYRNVLESSG